MCVKQFQNYDYLQLLYYRMRVKATYVTSFLLNNFPDANIFQLGRSSLIDRYLTYEKYVNEFEFLFYFF